MKTEGETARKNEERPCSETDGGVPREGGAIYTVAAGA